MDSNAVRGLRKLWTIAAHTPFSIIISQTSPTWISQIQSTGLSSVFLKAQPLKRALQWRKNDLLHKRDGNFVYNWPHPTLEHLFQTYWLIADKLFVKVSAQVSQQPSTYLDWNNNLKWKRVKYGDFPDQSQSFHILAHSSHRCKLHKAPKQTMSSLDWSGRKPSREPFIWVVNCVLHKSYSYEWFHSHFMQGFW